MESSGTDRPSASPSDRVTGETGPFTRVDGFVKIGDFEGSADDPQHAGWSPIIGLHASVVRSSGSFITSGQPVGSTRFGPVTIAKPFDGSSPKTQKACATGQKLSKVQLHVCTEVGGKPRVTTEIELTDVLVCRHEIASAPPIASDQAVELVSFAFGKIAWTFNKLDAKGGGQGKVSESHTIAG